MIQYITKDTPIADKSDFKKSVTRRLSASIFSQYANGLKSSKMDGFFDSLFRLKQDCSLLFLSDTWQIILLENKCYQCSI